jgi:transcriptional antiterminator NusG
MKVPAHAPWIALQVRSRSEVTVAEHLDYRGYDCYLPIRDGAPLFPGYVFCRFATNARAPIITTPGVIRVVSFAGAPAVIEDGEIAAISRAVASGLPVVPVASMLPGDPVTIVGGPLRGLRGTVLAVDDKRYLVVSITLLRRSIAVGVDPAWIEPDRCAPPARMAPPNDRVWPAAATA